jgi:hypothetical protein
MSDDQRDKEAGEWAIIALTVISLTGIVAGL